METKTMTNKESNLIKGLIEQHGYSAESASELVNTYYIGQYNSLADCAKEWINEIEEGKDNPSWNYTSNHLDYAGLGESLVKDCHIKSIYLTNDEKVHIFDGA